MSSAAAAQVRSAVTPALSAAGFHLEDVEVRQAGSRRLVQVLVDRDGGISLDDVADASRAISSVLDETDVFPGAYVLEVSSPGVDRPLTELRHWRRNLTRLVEVTPVEGPPYVGRVVAVDDEGATLEVDGTPRRVELAGVRKALVQVEFTRKAGLDEAGDIDDIDDTDEGGDDA